MNTEQAINFLLTNKDPKVVEAATVLKEQSERRRRILVMVQEALEQIRLDMKYIAFDLECTRRERDELRGK
jgi:hypothetical protein